MAFESSVVPEDWSSALIDPRCTKVKERGQNVAVIEVLACYAWLEKYR